MRVCVWRTGHEIADTVGVAAHQSLEGSRVFNCSTMCVEDISSIVSEFDIHIGYGILRSMDDVFRECDRQGKPWFNIDKGYWKPGHFGGYYRVSLRGTQQVSGWPEPDWERWKALGIEVEDWKWQDGNVLVCPPTDYVREFLDMKYWDWDCKASEVPLIRHKDAAYEICWQQTKRVITFNSSVGWEALRRGIPCESDPVHSIVGAWQTIHGTDKREELFATMAGLQLTLDEMRAGKLWPLMEKLLAKAG